MVVSIIISHKRQVSSTRCAAQSEYGWDSQKARRILRLLPIGSWDLQLNSQRVEVTSNVFTVFYADTSDEKRFLQILNSQFLCFALIFSRSPQNSCRFDPIYYRYQKVMALYEQGLGFTEIQSRVGLSRRTIERWIKEGGFPEAKRRRKRRSAFDPYAHYVLSRWEQGCTNGLQLYREIKEQGYTGSQQTIYRFLGSLRKKRRVIWKPEVPHAPLLDFSANEVV